MEIGERQGGHSRGRFVRRIGAAVVIQIVVSTPAWSAEYSLGDAKLHVRGIATFGSAWRASGRDAELIPNQNASAIGLQGRAAAGQNSDDGNLNYDRGDAVSTVLKGLADVELKYGRTRGFVRARAWTDSTLEHENVKWGNLPNGYALNQPLSDRGFHRLAEFSGVALMDAFVERSFGANDSSLFRFGNQSIPWGVPATIRGGLDQVNAQDMAARARPGASLDENWYYEQLEANRRDPKVDHAASALYPSGVFDIPTLAAFSSIAVASRIAAEGFYQFRFEPSQFPGCGAFGSVADYVANGCDKVLVGPLNDRQSLAAVSFGKRAPDLSPDEGGQYGLGMHYTNENLGRFGAYFANIHSRRFTLGAIKSTRPALFPPLIPGDPGGTNVRYFVEYPEDVRVYALNYLARTKRGSVAFAEVSHQPNQVLRLNATDLLNAFASNLAPTQLRSDATAVTPGGLFHGFDRHKVTQLNAGGRKAFDTMEWARWLQLDGEVAVKYVHDLPDVSVRRYGRGDMFGIGPVNGVACAGPSKQCSNQGYVTPMAWGYRLRATVALRNVAEGLALFPSIAFAHDVKGWSYDDMLSEKRMVASLSLRAAYGKRLFGELAWTSISGGAYNSAKDRDVVTASAGVSF